MKHFSDKALRQGDFWTFRHHFSGFFINNLKPDLTFSWANFSNSKPEQNFEFSNLERNFSRLDRKCAFTLAEVLITIGIVGIVVAITLPALTANISELVNSHRQANIAYKITQATDKMKAMGLLNGGYASTDAFVDELQKHLKIAKRCDANHIADCWPTNKVKTSDGEEFEVKDAKTGKNLNIESNTRDNVGLVLADGASIILTYNQNSPGMDIGDKITAQSKTLPVGFGKSKDFAYTTNTTGAIDFVMDVNGKKGPNSETRDNKYYDIRSFKTARFSKGCAGVDIPGIGCVVNLGTSYDCIIEAPYTSANNCWAGAKKACADRGMSLPDKDTLLSICNKKSEYPELPQAGWFWSSSEESTASAYYVFFNQSSSSTYRKYNHDGALCVGD